MRYRTDRRGHNNRNNGTDADFCDMKVNKNATNEILILAIHPTVL